MTRTMWYSQFPPRLGKARPGRAGQARAGWGRAGQRKARQWRAALSGVALILIPSFDVQAQEQRPVCGPRDQIVQGLAQKYSETPQHSGLMPSGMLLEVLVSPEGTWTIIVTHPQGRACLFSAGDGWASEPPQVPGLPL